MSNKELNKKFQEAVARVNKHKEPFPADTLLKLYAYYKRATNDYGRPRSREALINAFKTNALFQARNISELEAKHKYIELVNKYFLYRE
ncbi:acyl-CoA-binding protein [Seonamhaeicola sediminis]|uniref:Acyl-CoA-binding protein n=1 Tax=Seonamhaeicola sediminis TaxID=2528206 RepID=A0A562YIE1_9FLAO|nr:acyl-CoA-binding protein [Seonamhaeicola sediminis]TWO34449.1 acyl-CoA-binding protein [Seonamhaeicola sediminis]